MTNFMNEPLDYVRYAKQCLESGELDQGTYALVCAGVAQAQALIAIATHLEAIVTCTQDGVIRIDDEKP